jgi:hypothetical protein
VWSVFSGSRLRGIGSRERYRTGGAGIHINVERFPASLEPFGIGLDLEGFPPSSYSSGRELAYVRAELAAMFAIAAWRGDLPGSIVAGGGFGGETTRDTYAEKGRFYYFPMVRIRTWPAKDVPLQLRYDFLLSHASGLSFQDHRFEIASGYRLLLYGMRGAYTISEGGDPARTFVQQSISLFFGVGVY